jgi:O-antigen ligase
MYISPRLRNFGGIRRIHLWLILAASVTILVLSYAIQMYDWPAGVAVLGAGYTIAWALLSYPAARQEFATAWKDTRGLQIAVVILFVSCYVEGFFPEMALRASKAMQESPANPANIGRIGLIATAALTSAYMGRSQLRKLRIGFSGPLLGAFLFAAVALLSSTYSSLPLVSAGKALEVLADISSVIILASLLYADELQRSWNIIWLLLSLVLISVWVTAFLFPAQGFEYQEGAAFPLLTGAYPKVHPNTLGQLGASFAIVVLCRMLRGGFRLFTAQGLYYAGMFLFGVATMIGAEARTSMGSFAIAAAVCVYLYRRFDLLPYFGAALIVLAALGARDMVAEFLRRGQTDEVMYSLSGRFDYWLPAWNMFKDSPLFGHGFYTAHRIDLNLVWHRLDLSSVDNTYLELLLGVGLLGLIPLVAGLLTLARRLVGALRSISANGSVGDVLREISGVLIIILVRSATGPTFQIHGENLIFVLLIMALVQAVHLRRLSRPLTVKIQVRGASSVSIV